MPCIYCQQLHSGAQHEACSAPQMSEATVAASLVEIRDELAAMRKLMEKLAS